MGMKNSRWLSLLVLCTGFLLIVVDMTIVNVALPSIQRDLGFTQSGLAWVINAYLIAFGGLLLLAGRVGDLVGRKRVFLAGLALFTAASLLCGLSFSQPMLIAARFIQGIGGAVSSAVILAMIVDLFPEPLERAKAFGIFSFVASSGAVVGLIAGGLITQSVSWHWIFFVNLPLGIATALLAARVLESDRGIGIGQGADALGAVLVTVALMLGVYTIVQTADYGLVSLRTAILGAVAVGLLVAFVVRQARGRDPILPLRLFRSRKVTGSNVVQALMSTSFLGFFFVCSLDFQRVQGYGPMAIGLAFLPVAIVMALFSIRFSALLIGRFGAGRMLVAGQAAALESGRADGYHAGRVRGGGVEMRKLASFLMVTLDGYFEGEKPWDIDWHNTDEEFNDFAIEQLDTTDCLIFGRATYVGMAQYWPSAEAIKDDPIVATKMNSAPKIVVSRTLEEPEPAWSNTRLIRDVTDLAALKAEKGKEMLVMGSSVLTTSLMELGLLDELRIIINPVLIGAGNSLSGSAGHRISLKLLSSREFRSGNVMLTYAPVPATNA